MSSRSTSNRTLPLQVKNTGFLLDRLSQDCHPLQFLRELTHNSLEAIQRNGQPGEIIWDCDWNTYELTGHQKLSIVDNGAGMTGDEMRQYINNLSASINTQSMVGNYGVGAKIAAAPRNPAGVLYLSWKDGKGAYIHLWRNPADNTYGLKEFDLGNGEYAYDMEPNDELKPSTIDKNGTMVVLYGRKDDDNTMQAPEGTPAASRWIAKYLNTRYYRFPEGITVKAREGWEYPREDGKRNKLRTITGQKEYLDGHSDSSGRVELTGATAWWWILAEGKALSQDSNYYASSGHSAAIYKDELYEMSTGRGGTARLQQFGVIFGSNQVVIYLEPETGKQELTTNTARTQLLMGNEPLPWAEWAEEFRAKMPSEIDALIQNKAAGAINSDHSMSIRERLKIVLDLFKVSRYRPSPTGTAFLDPENMVRGGVPAASPSTSASAGSKPSHGGTGGTIGNIYSLFRKESGPRGEKVTPNLFPDTKWVSIADGSRTEGDMEDRAAKFLADQNTLLINRDFRVFKDMVARWTKHYERCFGAESAIRSTVECWFEQSLVETVIGIQAMRNSREWDPGSIEAALSPEALTAAVMQRYHIHTAIKRELGSKVGSLRDNGEKDPSPAP